jgi:hypothetical protein
VCLPSAQHTAKRGEFVIGPDDSCHLIALSNRFRFRLSFHHPIKARINRI